MSHIVEKLSWDSALARIDRKQGEHITLVGPTGAGKTELIVRLLESEPFWVAFATKRRDPTLEQLLRLRPMIVRRGHDVNVEIASRFVLQPVWSKRLSAAEQDKRHAEEFSNALNETFWQTGWTTAIDELEYIYRHLKVTSPVDRQLTQGRSQGNTLIVGTQRPRYVTLHAYEQATHLFIWRMSDLANITRAAELAGVNRRAVADVVSKLDRHDVLYVNTVTGDMLVTNTRWSEW